MPARLQIPSTEEKNDNTTTYNKANKAYARKYRDRRAIPKIYAQALSAALAASVGNRNQARLKIFRKTIDE